jgi:predicted naringenin-chalcone synthase
MIVTAPHDAPRLSRFEILRPAHVTPQGATLDWLAAAHALAEQTRSPGRIDERGDSFHDRLGKLLRRVACGPHMLGERGHEVPDVAHTCWDEMRIYDVHRDPEGAGTAARTALYARAALAAFERLYEREEDPPCELVHVTCTGYASPSAAQRLVAARGWGRRTRVTHAYHMGCYAALPAVRIAAGLLASAKKGAARADVVHTEVCSLHLHPCEHDAEQLVVQSLFADGHVRYAIERVASRRPSLAVVAEREEILPESAESMTWTCGDRGMHMTLSRDVPSKIAVSVRAFLGALFEDAGLSLDAHQARTVFAVHPGGPRIIDAVQHALGLRDDQVEASRDVLRRFGNMSSATLPHVWRAIALDDAIPSGTPLASVAFGPGLTVSGALMVREGGR